MFKYWAKIRKALEWHHNRAATPEARAYWLDLIGAVDILAANYLKGDNMG